MTELSIGYSPCPNDTFIFHALVHGLVHTGAISFAPPLLEDVETLNRWAMEARLDVSKLSFHALGHVLDRYVMLASGAALGRGCGPLLVTTPERAGDDPAGWTIAIPGEFTTAALLLALYAPGHGQAEVMRFDRIMSAVRSGRVDAGLVIHEGRFTYQAQGLVCVCDLGRWWEEETGLPIPLGCIAARRSLDASVVAAVEEAVRASILAARARPGVSLPYIRQHARELDRDVISSHIGLYVNDFSVDLGEEGVAAVQELLRRGRRAGIFPHSARLENER
ncbi:1,4-dihydroxy-6-naphthoate synthase [Thermodesulfobacteriota bacterium B35]